MTQLPKILVIVTLVFSGITVFAQESSPTIQASGIVELNEMTVVGMQSLITMKHNLIPKLWESFGTRGNEIKNRIKKDVALGVSFDMEEKDGVYEFVHLVGFVVSDTKAIPEGMTYKKIAAHTYAKFTHRGPLADLSKTYDKIFVEWLPTSGYVYDNEACDIEWYDERFRFEEEDSEFDIYVPILEKTE
jgi:AraC family transcriptional regulator